MSEIKKTPVLHLVLSWALVGLPLLWGFWTTVGNSMKLFE